MKRVASVIFFLHILFCGILNGQRHFNVSRLDLNTHSKELAPAFFQNGLVFCSDRRKDFIKSYTDYNNNPLTNLYFAEQKKDGKFEMPRLMAKELTTIMFEGPSAFNREENVIYFTRTIDVSAGNRNRNRGDTTFGIFISRLVNGQWSQPIAFEHNSLAYNTGYPYISDDGKHLYFCSDEPGGLGGFDIYVSELRGGNWSEPVNLGPEVNTGKNEVFPFLHDDSMLYFASRGHKQNTDLDIYSTIKVNGIWKHPVRLEAPLNTPDDDYGVIFNNLRDTAYFVSDRNGSADIFAAYSTIPSFTNCAAQKENDYCFVFYESNNNEVDTTAFAYEWNLGDGTKIRALEAEHCFAKPDTYLVELNIVDKLTRDVILSQASYNFVVEPVEQPFIAVSDTVLAGGEFRLNGKESYIKNFTIEEYFWDFDDGFRNQGVETRHNYRSPGIYNITLGIQGKNLSEGHPVSYCVTRKIVVLDSKK